MVRDYLASRYPAGAVSGLLPALPEQFAAQAQSWRWTQSTGDSTHIEISAEDFVRGADGRRTFLRDVTLRVFHEDTGKHDRVESAAMHMLEGGKLLSDGETVITLGVSDIEGGPEPVEVTTSEVIFDPDSNSASTHRDVRYEFADGEGSSRGAVYNASTGIVHMLADVRLVRFDAAGETRVQNSGRRDGLRRAGLKDRGLARRQSREGSALVRQRRRSARGWAHQAY